MKKKIVIDQMQLSVELTFPLKRILLFLLKSNYYIILD